MEITKLMSKPILNNQEILILSIKNKSTKLH